MHKKPKKQLLKKSNLNNICLKISAYLLKLRTILDIIRLEILLKERDFTMNKTELINVVAAEANIAKKDAEAAVNATFKAIAEAMKAGDKVQLIGFGTFDVKESAAREGRNPRTGETIKIAASKRPVFSAGSALKNSIN